MVITNFMTHRPFTVAPTDLIDKAINIMEDRAFHHLIVTDGAQIVGILSDRDILISTGWTLSIERRRAGGKANGHGVLPKRVEQIMSRSVHAVTDSDDVREAALLMDGYQVSAVPVVSEGRLSGIITDSDLLRWLDELAFDENGAGRFLAEEVQVLMSSPPICAAPDTPIDDVVSMVRRFSVRHVPVSLNDQLVGIISDRDLRRLLGWSLSNDDEMVAARDNASPHIPSTAAEIMHENVETVQPNATLREALRRMRDLRIHSLPVVKNGRLVGILTHSDFVKSIARGRLL